MRLAWPVTRDPVCVPVPGLIWTLIGGAWLLAAIAQVTGNAVLLDHHTLIESGPPLWIATILLSSSDGR